MSKTSKLNRLNESMLTCSACNLHLGRHKAVPGEGPTHPKCMFIGEAPGKAEDRIGRPFVGRAGMILEALLKSIGLGREEVFIGNIVKCIPLTLEGSIRRPRKIEIETCANLYLEEQVELIDPRLIITLGMTAAEHILKRAGIPYEGLSKIHGRPFKIDGKAVIATYHPAAALYNRGLMNVLRKDFLELRKILPSQL